MKSRNRRRSESASWIRCSTDMPRNRSISAAREASALTLLRFRGNGGGGVAITEARFIVSRDASSGTSPALVRRRCTTAGSFSVAAMARLFHNLPTPASPESPPGNRLGHSRNDPLRSPVGEPPSDWREGFFNPEFLGDYLNQTMVPVDEMALVPEEFRVPLPNKKLADAWNQK